MAFMEEILPASKAEAFPYLPRCPRKNILEKFR
jgi:hypothetical protein